MFEKPNFLSKKAYFHAENVKVGCFVQGPLGVNAENFFKLYNWHSRPYNGG